MKNFSRSGRIISAAAAILVLLGVLASAVYLHASSGAHAASSQVITPHAVLARPQYIYAGSIPNSGGSLSCQQPGASVRCYGPAQIRAAYNVQQLINRGVTGAGRTIVIIDAFQSPSIASDLHNEDMLFGIPDPTLNIIAPYGLTPWNPSDPNQIGWSGEITLDVEWSHMIAPGATIDLVLAKDNQDINLLKATEYAIANNLGDVISQSFGEAETCANPLLLQLEHKAYRDATSRHISIFASAGDQGAAQSTCDGSSYLRKASTPASDPLVTAVGGTYLNANSVTGQYIGESVWNNSFGAGGGGYSKLYASPSYQHPVRGIGAARGEPDVAYNADVNGGVLTVWSESGQGQNLVFIFGGTSAGSPQWAAITALADQYTAHRLGFLNAGIYRIGRSAFYSQVFHDTTVGNNTFTGAGSNGVSTTINGYNANAGWDAASGWGTPNVYNFVHIIGSFVRGSDGQDL